MKRLFICAAAALTLSACAATSRSGVSTAYAVSAYTVGGADAAYTAAEQVGELAVRAGTLPSATFHALDDRAYAALLALRAARVAGVKADVLSASNALAVAVAALNAFKAN